MTKRTVTETNMAPQANIDPRCRITSAEAILSLKRVAGRLRLLLDHGIRPCVQYLEQDSHLLQYHLRFEDLGEQVVAICSAAICELRMLQGCCYPSDAHWSVLDRVAARPVVAAWDSTEDVSAAFAAPMAMLEVLSGVLGHTAWPDQAEDVDWLGLEAMLEDVVANVLETGKRIEAGAMAA